MKLVCEVADKDGKQQTHKAKQFSFGGIFMTRDRTSPFEDIVMATSKLPWWIGVLLAVISYFALHALATRPAISPSAIPGQLGEVASRAMVTALAKFGQFIFPFAFGLAALISGINSFRQKKLYARTESRSDVASLNEMSWQDFERLVGEYYRRKDFLVTHMGGDGPDGGIDLVLRKDKELYLVQCKQWKAYKVGVKPVEEFYGVMSKRGAAGGYFVTSGVFTEDARTFANGTNLELINGHRLRRMIDEAGKYSPKPLPAMEPLPVADTPNCPKCGANMKKRLARQGRHTGKEFWGCSSFPRCKGTRPVEDNISGNHPQS